MNSSMRQIIVMLLSGMAPAFGQAANQYQTDAGATPPPTRLAQADSGRTDQDSARPHHRAAAPTQATLEEVIVTAQKTAQPLLDVPIPITAVAAASLVDDNQVTIQDFYTKFPTLAITYAQQSAVNLIVRGLPAAITLDDVPLSITSYLEEAGGLAFDLDPSGLKQVEVLRGPQGTLYGADSEGGLLRYVTADPTTSRLRGRVEAGVSDIYNGAEPGWNFRGSVNVPVSGDFALLVDGFARQDPGYIDNPILGVDGVNLGHTYGTHLAALWTPSDALSFKVGAFFQVSRGHGTDDMDVVPGLGSYAQNYIAGSGPYKRVSQLYSAITNYKFGNFQLTSVTGYVWTGFEDSYDATPSGLGPILQYGIPGTSFTGFGQPGILVPEDAHSSQFSQELRLSGHIGNVMDLLLGGFYDYAYGAYGENLLSSNPLTGAVAGDFVYVGFGSAVRDYAAFANLTAHITKEFQVQFGGRYAWDHFYSYGTTFSGPGNPLFGIPTSETTVVAAPNGLSQKFTFLVAPQYKLTPHTMLYIRVASGYEPGTPNPAVRDVPRESEPDTVINYDLGAKADLLDNRLSFDTSIYYAKHTDIQASFFSRSADIYYYGNGGDASVKGLELSTQVRPLTGLSVSGWVAWGESTQKIPPSSSLYGANGERLPYFPKWSGNLSIDQHFPVTASVTGFVGAEIAYVGDRGGGTDIPFSAYSKVDFHVGMEYDDWTARLYVNNAANKLGIINGGPATLIPYSYYYITPRVIGLQLSRNF